jgi:hypothetical protein
MVEHHEWIILAANGDMFEALRNWMIEIVTPKRFIETGMICRVRQAMCSIALPQACKNYQGLGPLEREYRTHPRSCAYVGDSVSRKPTTLKLNILLADRQTGLC